MAAGSPSSHAISAVAVATGRSNWISPGRCCDRPRLLHRAVMVGIAPPRSQQRDDGESEDASEGVRVRSRPQDCRRRFGRRFPVPLVEKAPSLMAEDLESPGVQAMLDAEVDALTAVGGRPLIVVPSDRGPGEVEVGAGGLLAEAPALAEIEAAFEGHPAVVDRRGGIPPCRRSSSRGRDLRDRRSASASCCALAPQARVATGVLGVQCEHRAVGISESKLRSPVRMARGSPAPPVRPRPLPGPARSSGGSLTSP